MGSFLKQNQPIQNFGLGGVVKGIGDAGKSVASVATLGMVGGSPYDTLGVNNNFQAQTPYSYEDFQRQQQNQQQIYGQQQQLVQALQAQAAGQGPNPAQAQYMQNVQNNVANAQGLAASQRGINPALAAKMGSNIGAQANQQAAAQSGLMQAEQQLGAQANLGNLYGQMQTGNLGNQQLYNQMYGNAQGLNAKTAESNTQAHAQLLGSILGAAGKGAAMGAAHGGIVPNYADGGMITNSGQMPSLFQTLQSMEQPKQMNMGGMTNYKMGGHVSGKAKISGDSPKNDTVPAMLSPGEAVIPRSVMNSEDAPDKARDFIAALLAHQKMGKKK